MTLGELTAICYQKIWQKNPLQLPDVQTTVHSPEEYEEAVNEVVEQYQANSDYMSLLTDAIVEVYTNLYTELGLSREEAGTLPSDTELPPKTRALAEKFRDFPSEMVQLEAD